MFNIDPRRYITSVLGSWFLFLMLAVFSAGVMPKLLALPMCILVVWLTRWCIDCAYRTEQFSKYANLRLFTNLALAPGFAFLMILVVAHKELKYGPIKSTLLACIPLLLATFVYLILYMWRSPGNSLIVRMQRAEVSEPLQQQRWLQGAMGAGLGSLVYPAFQYYPSSSSLLACFFIVISFFMLFYHRNSISALRNLKAQEAKDRQQYTFMALEEIRSQRAATFMGRFFARKTDA